MPPAAAADIEDAAGVEVRLLLGELSRRTAHPAFAAAADDVAASIEPADDLSRWAASGAMDLSGMPDGPPTAPAAPVASRLLAAAAVLAYLSEVAGTAVQLDGPALLGERAALRGLKRRGNRSAGGASRLLRAADGWLAVTLPRPEDVELVPAWLHSEDDSWEAVAAVAAASASWPLAARAQELGLAVAVVPRALDAPDPQLAVRPGARPWVVTGAGGSPRRGRLKVVDLSALWAGPLCANLLGLAGAEVVTVESVDRPDGARRGDPGLYALLHRGIAGQQLDLRSSTGSSLLHELIESADVVVTSARPRALQQLGFSPADEVARRPGLTWVAITGYGLTGPWCNRVAYGDDAAATGGLVIEGPLFCADAAADPSTGLYAAVAALACALSGGGVVDVSLREVSRHLARPPFRTTSPEVFEGADGWSVASAINPVLVAAPRARTA